MGERARTFARELANDFDFKIVYRQRGKIGSAFQMLRELIRLKPRVVYVLDMAASGVLAACAYRMLGGAKWIVDTGDTIVELGRALGRGPVAMALTRLLEWVSLHFSSAVVVRGSYHKELLAKRGIQATFIPDGVDVEQFAPPLDLPPKGLNDPVVIGIVGSLAWSPKRNTCYGWDLLDIVAHMRDRVARPVRGIVVGDGDGLERLKARCRELGLEDLVQFPGRVPYAELPGWIHKMDVCLSPQTDDVVGHVRTSGKLPLYLAANRFILASRVGEAARVLPEEMLVDGLSVEKWIEKALKAITQNGAVNWKVKADQFSYAFLGLKLKKMLLKETKISDLNNI